MSWVSFTNEPVVPRQIIGNRDVGLDLGRCVAALAVIYIHCSGIFLNNYKDLPTWYVADALNSFSRFAVPVFIMCSGAFLVGRHIPSTGAFLRRRLPAVMKPYVFGAVFYWIWSAYYQGTRGSAFSYLQSFLFGNAWFHLYFLPVLAGLYVITPLFNGLTYKDGKSLTVSVGIVFIMLSINQYASILNLGIGDFLPATVFGMFYISGFVLRYSVRTSLRFSALAFVISSLATAFIVALASWIDSKRSGVPFEEYTSITVVIQSVAFYAMLQHVVLPERIARFVIGLSELTLGIYILHFAIMTMLMDLVYRLFKTTPIEVVILTPIATFGAAALIVKGLHQIPGVKGFV